MPGGTLHSKRNGGATEEECHTRSCPTCQGTRTKPATCLCNLEVGGLLGTTSGEGSSKKKRKLQARGEEVGHYDSEPKPSKILQNRNQNAHDDHPKGTEMTEHSGNVQIRPKLKSLSLNACSKHGGQKIPILGD